jgi:hypothetical protein
MIFEDKDQSYAAVAKQLGYTNHQAFYYRCRKYGEAAALQMPPPSHPTATLNGVTKTITQWSKGIGAKNGDTKTASIYARIRRVGLEQAIKTKPKTPEMHGLSKTKVYRIWGAMLSRTSPVSGPRHKEADRYFNRGIRTCQEWRDSFLQFLEDMGPRPTPQHTLDRIDNDGNYEPGNVRWVTRRINQSHMCSTRNLTHKGVTQNIAAWSRQIGIKQCTISYRLDRGWSVERTLTEPIHPRRTKIA